MMNSSFLYDLDSLPKELKLLLAFMRIEQDNRSISIQRILSKDVDWDHFILLVRHHRVSAIIYSQLKKMNPTWVPSYVLETLHQEYHKNVFRMLHLSGELERICKLFDEHSIPTLLLKGPALAFDLYGDISHRTSRDLDILVNINQLTEVMQLVLDQGYVAEDIEMNVLEGWRWRQHHFTFYHPHKKICLEVHWRLSPGPSKEPSFQELWERRRINLLTSYSTYYLGEADIFCYLITHGARHGWFRLRWLADIDILVRRQTNWSNVKLLLKKYHSLAVGGQALILASLLLDTPLNKDMHSIVSYSGSVKLAQTALQFVREVVDMHSNPPEDLERHYRRYLFAAKSRRQKFVYILSHFYPYPIDAQTLPLPKYINFLYFPLRPILWTWRKAKKFAVT
ncbi:nucleotidyltransferase family protein [Cohnella sp.]|uniref:nucleotidyltransferase domain-containing protein n=1 Tax=Cohnella sp. TaxID=1883426 RepID=UPI003565B24E